MKNDGMHKGHRERLKQRALKSGLNNLPEHEILEVILTYSIPFKDVNPLAHSLIDHFGSLANVLDAGFDQLVNFKNVGKQTATFLSLLPEMFYCYKASKETKAIILGNVYQCVNYFRNHIRLKEVEEFYMLCLDSKHQLKKTIIIDGGNVNSISFSPQKFASNLSTGSYASVVLMHNHPGNSVTPTKADLVATHRLMQICCALGIRMRDHIIINNDNYYSFLNNRLLLPMEQKIIRSMNDIIINDETKVEAPTDNE